METTFTPFASLAGGALIGLSAVALLATLGRILGATGIVAALLTSSEFADRAWRAALVLGMLTAPLALTLFTEDLPKIDVPASPEALIIGGLIVGAGASIGSGCTSGHGVCGLARLSRRSAVATTTFMATAAITVFISRHVLAG